MNVIIVNYNNVHVGILAMTIYLQMVLMLAWRLQETLDHGKENARWLLNFFYF
jgi:hypothetical protein